MDGSGNVYVAGDSNATWGSPVRAYTAGLDAFAAKLTAAGALTWNTFLGGSGDDAGLRNRRGWQRQRLRGGDQRRHLGQPGARLHAD